MEQTLREFAKACGRPFKWGHVQRQIEEMSKRPDCLVLSLDGGNAVLIANIFTHFWDPGYYMTCEQAMWVRKACRGQGLGKQLIEEYIKWAEKCHVDEIEIAYRCDLSDFDIEELFMKYGFEKQDVVFRRKA